MILQSFYSPKSNSRFLVEVTPENCAKFEKAIEGIPCLKIGTVQDSSQFQVTDPEGKTVIDLGIDEMKSSWQKTLAWD